VESEGGGEFFQEEYQYFCDCLFNNLLQDDILPWSGRGSVSGGRVQVLSQLFPRKEDFFNFSIITFLYFFIYVCTTCFKGRKRYLFMSNHPSSYNKLHHYPYEF